jgi:hypothetical protein
LPSRPAADEYAPYYASYVDKVPDGDIISRLAAQRDEVEKLLEAIPPEKETYRYAEGKWSVREVVGHIIDAERVFAYRTLVFARGDRTPQPGFEQDDYVAASGYHAQPIADLVSEFIVHRNSYLWLVRAFGEDIWMRGGTANGVEFTVRSIPWIIAGHAAHHLDVLKERYL